MLAETLRKGVHKRGMGAVCSTDDFFLDDDGVYQFDSSKLGDYHAKNVEAAEAMMRGHQTQDHFHCIIDNTNTQHWEYEKYVEVAKKYGFMVQVISIDWEAMDIPLYAERNSHGVPIEAIYRMAARWER